MAEGLRISILIFVVIDRRLCIGRLFHPGLGVGEALHAPSLAGLDVFNLEIRLLDPLIVQEPPVADQERAINTSGHVFVHQTELLDMRQ
jgi:hypothetical protein